LAIGKKTDFTVDYQSLWKLEQPQRNFMPAKADRGFGTEFHGKLYSRDMGYEILELRLSTIQTFNFPTLNFFPANCHCQLKTLTALDPKKLP
jgi:hypothetical protein